MGYKKQVSGENFAKYSPVRTDGTVKAEKLLAQCTKPNGEMLKPPPLPFRRRYQRSVGDE